MNDHCPVLNVTNYEFEPVPALEVEPILNISATDIDTGLNADITYFVSYPIVEYVDTYICMLVFSMKSYFTIYFLFTSK